MVEEYKKDPKLDILGNPRDPDQEYDKDGKLQDKEGNIIPI
jgi:hypothetical protein